jgi:hypothetical protein
MSQPFAQHEPLQSDAEGTMNEWLLSGFEPPLDEILDEPIIRILMESDKTEPDEVRRLLRDVESPYWAGASA